MNELNNTVPTSEYKTPAETWGQVVRCGDWRQLVLCKDCKFSVDANGCHIEGTAPEGAIRCENEECPLCEYLVPPNFGCILGELLQQSHGDNPI